MKIYRLENTVQRYAWGSLDGLESTLGIPNPERKPAAEIWMGAHPGAPSVALLSDGSRMRLDALIASDPTGTLGFRVASRFGNILPFLFKGLSAGTPLSIQTHPDKKTAKAGFARENAAGIPLSSPVRTYRDDNHKPEMALAMTAFEGLCGFRAPKDIVRNLKLILEPDAARRLMATDENLQRIAGDSKNAGDDGNKDFLHGLVGRLLGLRGRDREYMLTAARAGTESLLTAWEEGKPGPGGIPAAERGAFVWVSRLSDLFPCDAGILMPLVLNRIAMQPGESVYIGAGIMHAYLSGTALEIMANSDNVIRGGLSSKHIDLPELLEIVDFKPSLPVLETAIVIAGSGSEAGWPVHAEEFALERIELSGSGDTGFGFLPDGPEIVLCSERSIRLHSGNEELELKKGESAFIRADAGGCRIAGAGIAYRARVPAR